MSTKYKFVILSAVLLFISGCTSLNLGTANVGNNVNDKSNTETQSAVAVVQGQCPRTNFREGTTFFRAYARGKENDPSQITYQASLADATRTCAINEDQLKVSVFAAGRVLAGPKGKAGTFELPIRVAVIDRTTNEVLYSELTQQAVTLTEPNLTGQFLFNDPNIVLPAGAAGETLIFVGFDEGPTQ